MTAASPGAQPVTPAPAAVPTFAVIPGDQVQHVLRHHENEIIDLVEATYRLHGAGDTVNPPSYFLQFPDRPSARIIALPASIGGRLRVDGLKWVSSFPENVSAGHSESVGCPDPQRPRHRLPVRLPGSLHHQRHQDGGERRSGGGLAQPRPGLGPPDARRVLRYRPDRPLHSHLSGRRRVDVRRDRRARPGRRQRGRLPRLPGTVRRHRQDHGVWPPRAADPLQRPRNLRHRRRAAARKGPGLV